jgi:hypothetical protein
VACGTAGNAGSRHHTAAFRSASSNSRSPQKQMIIVSWLSDHPPCSPWHARSTRRSIPHSSVVVLRMRVLIAVSFARFGGASISSPRMRRDSNWLASIWPVAAAHPCPSLVRAPHVRSEALPGDLIHGEATDGAQISGSRTSAGPVAGLALVRRVEPLHTVRAGSSLRVPWSDTADIALVIPATWDSKLENGDQLAPCWGSGAELRWY